MRVGQLHAARQHRECGKDLQQQAEESPELLGMQHFCALVQSTVLCNQTLSCTWPSEQFCLDGDIDLRHLPRPLALLWCPSSFAAAWRSRARSCCQEQLQVAVAVMGTAHMLHAQGTALGCSYSHLRACSTRRTPAVNGNSMFLTSNFLFSGLVWQQSQATCKAGPWKTCSCEMELSYRALLQERLAIPAALCNGVEAQSARARLQRPALSTSLTQVHLA